MPVKYPYLLNRNGYFYFRISVPKKLFKFFQRKELTYSLSTQCRIEAQSKSLILHQAALLLFGRVNPMSQVSPEALNKSTNDYFRSVLDRQSVMTKAIDGRLQSSPNGFDLEKELARQDYFFKEQFIYGQKGEQRVLTGMRLDKEGIYTVNPDLITKQIISESGLDIFPNSRAYIAIKQRAPALITALNQEYEKLAYGDWKVDMTNTGPSLSEHWLQYIDEMKRAGLSTQTIRDKGITFAKWEEIMGDVPLGSLDKAKARKFKDCLSRLPSNATKKHKGKSITDILALNIPVNELMKPKTINGYLSDLRSYVTWLGNQGLFLNDNPFLGISMTDKQHPKDKRNSLSEDQLIKLFSCPIFTGCAGRKQTDRNKAGKFIIKDSRYWTPLIGIFTGARLNEILQLYKSDIIEAKGIWYFDFNKNGTDKSLKNRSSFRKVPIHSFLIKLGFLDYLLKLHPTEQRVFPDTSLGSNGKYSDPFSKKFAYLLKKLGIKMDSKDCFHSIRHTVIDQFRMETNVSLEVAEAITGHTNGSTHSQYGSRNFPLEKLKIAVEEISYPYLEDLLLNP